MQIGQTRPYARLHGYRIEHEGLVPTMQDNRRCIQSPMRCGTYRQHSSQERDSEVCCWVCFMIECVGWEGALGCLEMIEGGRGDEVLLGRQRSCEGCVDRVLGVEGRPVPPIR